MSGRFEVLTAMNVFRDGVKTRGMGEFSRLNWHGSGAVLQVTLTGTLLSAGAERVLCKWLPSSVCHFHFLLSSSVERSMNYYHG